MKPMPRATVIAVEVLNNSALSRARTITPMQYAIHKCETVHEAH